MKNRAALWTIGGSVLSAVLASACCWLPLVLFVFGLSAAGISAAFETVRPFFLAGAGVLLAAGFYLNYFRREKCAPGAACERPNPTLRRFNRTMLWMGTIAVLTFALFPTYVGALFGDEGVADVPAAPGSIELVVGVEGMTCEACEIHVEKSLLEVPGVSAAEASHEEGIVTLRVSETTGPSANALEEAIEKAGYERAGEPE